MIDLHVHLREPGQAAKETIGTGTAAAARGGFTTIVCMPNTSPSIDNSGTVALIRERAEKEGKVNVFVTGAITKGIAGEELAPIGSLKKAGVVAITDDGHCVQSNELMRRAALEDGRNPLKELGMSGQGNGVILVLNIQDGILAAEKRAKELSK